MRFPSSARLARAPTVAFGKPGPVPSTLQLKTAVARGTVGAALVAVSVVHVHVAGLLDQQPAYLIIALALLPQVAVAQRARRDLGARSRLRTSARPMPLLAAMALVLAVAGAASLASGGWGDVSGRGALLAAAGLALSAAPTRVVFAPRWAR